MNKSERIHRLQQTLLLAPDLRQTVLAELGHGGLNRLAYTPYGAQSAGLPVSTRMGFNGELRGVPHGWYHLGNGHRVFNPILMRFHSPDRLSPFGEGGLNPYAYCLGDPINYVDPTGQVPSWLQPVLTIGLHVAIIANALFTIMAPYIAPVTPPLAGKALAAVGISLIGSPIAIAGSTMQLAGVEEGRILSAIGTGISTVGVGSRLYLAAKAKLAARKAAQVVARAPTFSVGRVPINSARELNVYFPSAADVRYPMT